MTPSMETWAPTIIFRMSHSPRSDPMTNEPGGIRHRSDINVAASSCSRLLVRLLGKGAVESSKPFRVQLVAELIVGEWAPKIDVERGRESPINDEECEKGRDDQEEDGDAGDKAGEPWKKDRDAKRHPSHAHQEGAGKCPPAPKVKPASTDRTRGHTEREPASPEGGAIPGVPRDQPRRVAREALPTPHALVRKAGRHPGRERHCGDSIEHSSAGLMDGRSAAAALDPTTSRVEHRCSGDFPLWDGERPWTVAVFADGDRLSGGKDPALGLADFAKFSGRELDGCSSVVVSPRVLELDEDRPLLLRSVVELDGGPAPLRVFADGEVDRRLRE